VSSAYSASGLAYGSEAQGGKIACLGADGGIDDLVVATKDSSEGITWGGEGSAVGPAAQSDTDGMGNTKAIIAKLGTSTKYAALLCREYEVDSLGNTPCLKDLTCYNDWFLPSRYQLDCVHAHKKEIGGFADDFYWSSSEFAGYPAYSAWDKFFGESEQEIAGVDDDERVRCVRVFNPPG